jgi:hypothetical protein
LRTVSGRTVAVVAIAIIFGAGLGLQIGGMDVAIGDEVGLWLALLSGAALIVVFVAGMGGSGVSADSSDVDRVAWMEFRRELRRARRHRRPLTLMRIPGGHTDGSDGPHDLRATARLIGARLRLIDRTWVDDGSIYVMLPESPGAAASTAVQRATAVAPGLAESQVRVATFPDDGLTSGALIAAVNDRAMGEVPIPIRPVADDDTTFPEERDLPMAEIAHQR